MDRNGSAAYNPESQRFRCHTCGVAGDGYDIIISQEGGSFQTAQARAAEICGSAFTVGEAGDGLSGRSRLTARRNQQGRSKLIRKKYGR